MMKFEQTIFDVPNPILVSESVGQIVLLINLFFLLFINEISHFCE